MNQALVPAQLDGVAAVAWAWTLEFTPRLIAASLLIARSTNVRAGLGSKLNIVLRCLALSFLPVRVVRSPMQPTCR